MMGRLFCFLLNITIKILVLFGIENLLCDI